MARTLYDILELSPSASAEAVQAAYDRLAAKFDPTAPANEGKADVRMQSDAVKEAFLTLSDPVRRLRYDRSIGVRPDPGFGPAQPVEPFWTWPKFLLIGLALVAFAGWHVYERRVEARLAAEREIAAAKAREAEAKAREEAERAQLERLEQDRAREARYAEERKRAETERLQRAFEREVRSRDMQARTLAERERIEQMNQTRRAEMEKQRAESDQRRREADALNNARRQAAREREELCRIERERYGKAISC